MMTLLMSGCTSCQEETNSHDNLFLSTIPAFPAPHPAIVAEIKEIRQKVKCPHLKDWLGKLMVFERQLKEIEKGRA